MIVDYGTGRDIFLVIWPLPSSVPVVLTWAMARQVFNFLSPTHFDSFNAYITIKKDL